MSKKFLLLAFIIFVLTLIPAYNSYGDTTAPRPSPMKWLTVPATTGPYTITMTTVTALDAGNDYPVPYLFECTDHSEASSTWQADANYTATGLTPSTVYTFKARARDSAGNQTSWTAAISATTDADSNPPVLRLDLNNSANNDDANTQTGFLPFIIEDSGIEVNGIIIDLGGDIATARRDGPSGSWARYGGTPTLPGDPCYYSPRAGERIYRDFICGTYPSGVGITLWGLGVNQDCNITIWAYDACSVGDVNRVASWYANGTYIFDTVFKSGATGWPRYDNQTSTSYLDLYKYAFKGRATADSLGRIVLTGSMGAGSPAGQDFAFVNAIKVEPNALVSYVPTNYAYHPVPVDNAEDVTADAVLHWRNGGLAETHDVYFGTSETAVTDANRGNPLGVLVSEDYPTTTYTPPESLDLNTTYYWRIDEVNGAPDYTIFKGEVWSFTTSAPYVPVLIASNPVPPDGAKAVPTDTTLSWESGEYAATHDVYFGTDPAKITDANRSNPLGVLVSQDQSATTYDLPESLYQDTIYYWRIDEVNAAPDYTIFKGEVWSFTTHYNEAHSGTIDPPYEAGTWRGFRSAAISYTFDDGTPNQLPVAIPIFDEFGYKATMFVVTQWVTWDDGWPGLRAAASAGHEVASHTVDHYIDSNPATQIYELGDSLSAINSNIPNQQGLTLAYPPAGDEGPYTLVPEYYIAARGGSGIEQSTPASFYAIGAIACGSENIIQTPEDFNQTFEDIEALGGWGVFCIHGIDNDGGFSPLPSTVLRSSLEYLDARRDMFWVESFGNVVRYIRERNDVSVTELSNQGSSITLQVTDTLGDTNYNYPVTLRRPLPEGWSSAYVSQDSLAVVSSIVDVNSTAYVMFDVVPDGGDVVLSKYYGDFTGGGVDMNDLAVFCSYWLLDDCNETEGVDLNEDCIVNFYEFSILAESWLKTP